MKARQAKAMRANSLLALVPSKESVQDIINTFGVVREEEEDTAGGKYKTTRQQFRGMEFDVPDAPGYIDVYGNFLHVLIMKGVDPEEIGALSGIKPITMHFSQQLQLAGQNPAVSVAGAPKRYHWVLRSSETSEEWGALSEYMKERYPTRKPFNPRITLQKYRGWSELPGDRGEEFLAVQKEAAESNADAEVIEGGESSVPVGKTIEIVFDKLVVASQPQKVRSVRACMPGDVTTVKQMDEPVTVLELGAEEDI